MRNELWQTLFGHGSGHRFTEEEISRCIYKIRTEGSPYVEVEDDFNARMPDGSYEIAVNPYIRLGKILYPLLEDTAFCDSPEGQLLFHEAVQLMSDIDRVSGADMDTLIRQLVYEEIAEGCYGREIADFLTTLGMQEKSAVLDYLLLLYRNGREPYPFIGAILLLFPQSVVFREKQKPDMIYIFMNTAQDERQLARYKAAKMLFLPMGITVKLSWEQPFILTDINDLEQYGNTLA